MEKISLHDKKKLPQPLKVTHRSSLVEEVTDKQHVNLYDKNVLNRVLKYLRKKKKKERKPSLKESCPVEDSTEGRVDSQVKLRCRQLTNVVQELRKSIMRQEWNEAAALLMILCHPGLKYYSTIIIRTCFILLYNHPNSNLNLVRNFVRNVTEYVLDEDINKFIRISFALKKEGLENLKNFRKLNNQKVTRDTEFENL